MKVDLSYAERLILANQYAILEKLDPDNGREYMNAQEIVQSGYEFLYETLNPSMDRVIPAEASQEVFDILDMFRAIEGSAQDIGKTPAELRADFEGFDANNDHEHYGFCRFVRRSLGRWSELDKYPDNSHSTISLPRYREMLKRWRALGSSFNLTEREIVQVAG